ATGKNSCTALTAADNLGAFNWVCDGSTNPVTCYSRGLKEGKGLRYLVTTTAWISNYVTASAGGAPVYKTPSTIWYANAVNSLASNTTGSPKLLTPGNTIWVAGSNITTDGFYLKDVDKSAIVTLGSNKITWGTNTTSYCLNGDGSNNALAIICIT